VPAVEVAARLGVSPKTLKRLHREAGLPLVRIHANGLVGFWSEIEAWVRRLVEGRG
jgi:hypothetical protein